MFCLAARLPGSPQYSGEMVMFSMWPRTASDPKIGSDFPMSGEGTGLGVPAPALAGYLGKVS